LEALGINLFGLIAQIVNLAILFFLLNKLLFKRILKTMEERTHRIQEGLEKAERADAQMAQADAVFQEKMGEIERERESILASAREEAEQLKAEATARAREEARNEAQRILAQEREAFEAERQQAMTDMHNQIVGLVLAAARKVIEEDLDEKKQRKLIERFLSEMGTQDEVQ